MPRLIHTTGIHLLSAGLALMVIFVDGDLLFPYVVSKHLYLRVLILCGVVLLVSEVALGRRLPRLNRGLLIIIGVLMLWNLAVALTGVGFSHSFWSGLERMEGVVGLGYWMSLAMVLGWNLRGRADWLILLRWQLSVASLVALVAISSSHLHLPWQNFFYSPDPLRVSAGWGNPGYTGMYAGFHALLAIGLCQWRTLRSCWWNDGLWTRLLPVLALFANIGLLWISDSRAPVLGVLGALGVLAIYRIVPGLFAQHKHQLTGVSPLPVLLFIGMLVTACAFLMFLSLGEGAVNQWLAEQIGGRADTVLIRFKVWAIAFEAFTQRPFLGWGPDQFFRIFALLEPDNASIPTPFDRVHNIYFEALVAGGIPGLVFLLSLFGLALRRLMDTGVADSAIDQDLRFACTAAMLCYLLMGLFWPDTLVSQYIVAIALAWALQTKTGTDNNTETLELEQTPTRVLRFTIFFIGAVLVVIVFVQTVQAPYRAGILGSSLLGEQKLVRSIEAVEVWLDKTYKPAELQGVVLQSYGEQFVQLDRTQQRRAKSILTKLSAINLSQELPDWKRIALAIVAVQRVSAINITLLSPSEDRLKKLELIAPNRPETVQLKAFYLVLAGEKHKAARLLDDYLSRHPVHIEQLRQILELAR